VELAVGDLRDADHVAESTRGVDAVLWVHPTTGHRPTRTLTPNAPEMASRRRCGRTGSPAWCSRAVSAPSRATAPGAGRLTTTRPLDEPMSWVDPRDIAAVAAGRLLATDWTGRQVQAVHGPADLTWPEAAAASSTATGVPIEAKQITDDEQRAALREAGMSDVAVEGIAGMAMGKREGFTPEQPRTALTTAPGTLAGWAITHLRPALQPRSPSP
jgi:uncharacterized protein YbjT (DUF2867 family)